MTLTIELPEDLAAELDRLPEKERPEHIVALMRFAVASRQNGTREPHTTSVEELDATLAEIDALIGQGSLLTPRDLSRDSIYESHA